MADERDTGEHFFRSLGGEEELSVQTSARRVADLMTQIEFLDREIARYREIVEQERIRHATEIADLQLASDTRVDELRRDERLATQAIHDSYRSLLNERQLEFDRALSSATGTKAEALAAERQRSDELLNRERNRREVLIEAGRKQAVDELSREHQRDRQTLMAELANATTSIERLQGELADRTQRTAAAEARSSALDRQVAELQRTIANLEKKYKDKVADAETRLARSTRRIAAERRRSAATLSEVLERSAVIAAEADRARSEFAAERAKAAHTLASAQQKASDEYTNLTAAADDRAERALEREAELESVIAELRYRLTASQAAPKYCDEGDIADS